MSVMNTQVERAAHALGLTGPFPQLQYVNYMERAFGREGSRFLDAVDGWVAEGASPERAYLLYEMLARRPAMATYVSRHQYSKLYAATAKMLLETPMLPGRTVIDYGCGFGLLTRLLALLHPDTQFVGIDRAPIVIAARKWQRGSEVKNIQFESDVGASPDLAHPRLVLMVCVTHEMFNGVMDGKGNFVDQGAEAGAKLRDLVGSDGLLLTINRMPHPNHQLPRLDAVMERLGLHATTSECPAALFLEEGGRSSELPIRIYNIKPAAQAAVKSP